jgi:hypothetical protein
LFRGHSTGFAAAAPTRAAAAMRNDRILNVFLICLTEVIGDISVVFDEGFELLNFEVWKRLSLRVNVKRVNTTDVEKRCLD